MGIENWKLSPGTGRWPKDKNKQALRRYRLDAAKTAKQASARRRYGTLGAASPVRKIDPASYKPQ